MGEDTVLEIGPIKLDWSDWVPWRDVSADNRAGAGVSVLSMIAGVYEVCSLHRAYHARWGDCLCTYSTTDNCCLRRPRRVYHQQGASYQWQRRSIAGLSPQRC
jgi:hypothetical protein